jgi:GTPase
MLDDHGRAHGQIACREINHLLTAEAQRGHQWLRQTIHQGAVARQGHHEEAAGSVTAGHQPPHPIRHHLIAQLAALPERHQVATDLHRLGEAGSGNGHGICWDVAMNSECFNDRKGPHGKARVTNCQCWGMETLPASDSHLPYPAGLGMGEVLDDGMGEGMEEVSAEVLGAMPAPEGFRSGFVALIGRPNVGKSTLVNQLVGKKVAITSPVAQTTRNRLRAILTTPAAQLVLLDTPGIHKPHHLLGERLVRSARSAIGEVDVVLLLVDGSQPAGRGDAFVVELLRQLHTPVHVVLNKWDRVPAGDAGQAEQSYRELLLRQASSEAGGGAASWPLHRCSALTGEGCSALVEALSADLPPGPHLYPADAVSDQPERLLLAELVREQVLSLTREEVPHSVAVQIERIVEDGPRTAVLATILVERASQKGILIGRGGAMLKMIGQGARLQMQKVFDGPVYLELFVKVVPNWRQNPARLNELGYGVE